MARSPSQSSASASRSRSGSPASKGSKASSPEKKVEKKRSPSPEEEESKKIHISGLTRNVTSDHLREIFGLYGPLKDVELVVDKRVNLSKGTAYVEFESRKDAEEAQLYMDGGQVDGNDLRVNFVLLPSRQRANSGRSASPPRGGRTSRDRDDRKYNSNNNRSPVRGGSGTFRRDSYRPVGGRRSPPRGHYGRSPPRRNESPYRRSGGGGYRRSPPRRSPPRRSPPGRRSSPRRSPPRRGGGRSRSRSPVRRGRGRSRSSSSGSRSSSSSSSSSSGSSRSSKS